MKESEGHAPPFEYFVKWRKYHVAHAGLQSPEKRAAKSEEHPERSAHRQSRRLARTLRVRILVGKCQIVDAANYRRIKRSLRRAVEPKPFAQFVIVDRVEAARVGREPKAHDSRHHRERQIDYFPQAAQFVVV